MTNAIGNIDEFRKLCSAGLFPHREEILQDLESRYLLTRSPGGGVPAKSMLEIYTVRAGLLTKKLVTEHARQMLSDVSAYVKELEKAPDDFIMLWDIAFDQKSSYALFEGVKSGRFLGCIYGVDKRKVSEDEWAALWAGDYQ